MSKPIFFPDNPIWFEFYKLAEDPPWMRGCPGAK